MLHVSLNAGWCWDGVGVPEWRMLTPRVCVLEFESFMFFECIEPFVTLYLLATVHGCIITCRKMVKQPPLFSEIYRALFKPGTNAGQVFLANTVSIPVQSKSSQLG